MSSYALFLWLFIAIGPFTDVLKWRLAHPAWGAAGLAAFVACYCFAIVLAFGEDKRPGRLAEAAPSVLAGTSVVLATALASSYHSWGALYALAGVVCGAVFTGRLSRCAIILLPVISFAACSASHKDEGWSTAFNAFLSILVTNAFLELMSTVLQLKETREELARSAVATERLRFSRDLHDLLGHSMSVIAVKAEATRRLAPIDLKLALEQAADIEAVSRQALTEIREAVTGYRQVSLAEELDQACTALRSAGIRPVVRESGPPLSAQTEALLGWVVREGVTNVIRHSGGRECVIELLREQDPVQLRIRDDGTGSDSAADAGSTPEFLRAETCPGNGLKGLAERLATAGGTLAQVPSAKGFVLLATLPGEPAEPGRVSAGSAEPVR
ncbi:MAG TPA: histidine kinase [Actinocrinis sp.]|nr:histidine kinase [Actinocrinis sp.]